LDKKKFNTVEKCKKHLFNNYSEKFKCYKCNGIYFYKGFEFAKICKSCKSKTYITQNTIFHNVRFGIVKAFEITIDYHNSNYTLKSNEVSKNYDITQKTAWYFLDKIRKNKEYIEVLFANKTKLQITNEEKLRLFSEKYVNEMNEMHLK
jgi:hypothetical protein